MMAFPCMLTDAARVAGMKVPDFAGNCGDIRDVEGVKDQYPHFYVYCVLQLCRPITWGKHWNNASIVASIPEDSLRTMCEDDFVKLGFDP